MSMKNQVYVAVLAIAIIALLPGALNAQPSAQRAGGYYATFIDYQKTFERPDESFRRKEDTLQKQFKAKGLTWPAKYVYIRSFKYDSQLEVWVKDELSEPFKLFKTYKVCALAGTLGPKRMEGDYQVPEGFYYINEFNPKSSYYLSLGLNYPNASDRILSDSLRPGSAIYIHGSCVTVGCIPLTDEQIDEVYILGAHAKSLGQDYIPVHIFPIRYNVKRSANHLNNLTKDDPSLKEFTDRLSLAFNYFEKHRQLPVVMINDAGEYLINGKSQRVFDVEKPVKRIPVMHRYRNIPKLVEAVHQWPEFPGGGEAFMAYLEKLGMEMVDFLPEAVNKSYVKVEFIVDTDGIPTNFKVISGSTDEDFNDELIKRMEAMPQWKPAQLNNKAVPKKMIQTVTVTSQPVN